MKFFIKNKQNVNEIYELTSPMVSIGSENANLIVIHDNNSIAEYHSQFISRNGEYMIVDLGSDSGTIVNGQKIVGSQLITNGDEIIIGNKVFEYITDDSDNSFIQFEPSSDNTKKTKTVTFKPAVPSTSPSIEADSDKLFTKEQSTVEPAATLDVFDEGKLFSKDKVKKVREKKPFKKRIFDLCFYLLVLILAGVSIFAFVSQQTKKTININKTEIKEKPFYMSYFKEINSDNNIFSFRLEIKGDKVRIVLDDLLSRRIYAKELILKDSDGSLLNLEKLKSSIEATGFSKLKNNSNDENVVDSKVFRRIKLYNAGILSDYIATDDYPPNSFIRIESAIDDFVEELGYSSFPKSPKELQDEARDMYSTANDYFDNWLGSPGNLLLAKKRYERAIEFLDQFEPKPIMWKRSKARLLECNKLLEKRIKNLKSDFNKARNLNQQDIKIKCLKELMALTPKDSKVYKGYADRKTKIELLIKKRRSK